MSAINLKILLYLKSPNIRVSMDTIFSQFNSAHVIQRPTRRASGQSPCPIATKSGVHGYIQNHSAFHICKKNRFVTGERKPPTKFPLQLSPPHDFFYTFEHLKTFHFKTHFKTSSSDPYFYRVSANKKKMLKINKNPRYNSVCDASDTLRTIQ